MDHMERRQNEELMEARRLRRQEQKRKLLMRQRVLAAVLGQNSLVGYGVEKSCAVNSYCRLYRNFVVFGKR